MAFVDGNRHWLVPYVRQMADAMGLPHWEITVKEGWPEDAANNGEMCVYRSNNYYTADIHFNRSEYTDDDLRAGIAHEMVHLITRDYDQAAQSIENHVAPAAWSIYSDRCEHEMEQVVDAIAKAWAQTLPLPVRTKARKVKA